LILLPFDTPTIKRAGRGIGSGLKDGDSTYSRLDLEGSSVSVAIPVGLPLGGVVLPSAVTAPSPPLTSS